MTAMGYGYTTNRVFGKADNTGYRCGLLLVHSLPLEIPVGVYVETWNNLGKLFTDLGWNRKKPATTNYHEPLRVSSLSCARVKVTLSGLWKFLTITVATISVFEF